MKTKVLILSLLSATFFACTKQETISPENYTKTIKLKKGEVYVYAEPILSSPGSTGLNWLVVTVPDAKIAKMNAGETLINAQPANAWGPQIWKIEAVGVGQTKAKVVFSRSLTSSENYGEGILDITVTE